MPGKFSTNIFGERLDGLLRASSAKLQGIINGIDYEVYNPATDPKIFVQYDKNTAEKKVDNKVPRVAEGAWIACPP